MQAPFHSAYAVDYAEDIELNARCEKATVDDFVAVQSLTEQQIFQ